MAMTENPVSHEYEMAKEITIGSAILATAAVPDNSSKCSNCYGPRAFGGPVVLCVKLFLFYMQKWTLEFRCPRLTLRKRGLYFTHAIRKLYSLKAN